MRSFLAEAFALFVSFLVNAGKTLGVLAGLAAFGYGAWGVLLLVAGKHYLLAAVALLALLFAGCCVLVWGERYKPREPRGSMSRYHTGPK